MPTYPPDVIAAARLLLLSQKEATAAVKAWAKSAGQDPNQGSLFGAPATPAQSWAIIEKAVAESAPAVPPPAPKAKLGSGLPGDPFERVKWAEARMRAALAASGGKGGKFPTRSGGWEIIHPSASKPGYWRATDLTADGEPTGHSDAKDEAAAFKAAREAGAIFPEGPGVAEQYAIVDAEWKARRPGAKAVEPAPKVDTAPPFDVAAELPLVSVEETAAGEQVVHHEVPFPVVAKPHLSEARRETAKATVVPMEDLHASQEQVIGGVVNRYAAGMVGPSSDKLPVVVEGSDGTKVIDDGHHRLTALKLKGETQAHVNLIEAPSSTVNPKGYWLDRNPHPPCEESAYINVDDFNEKIRVQARKRASNTEAPLDIALPPLGTWGLDSFKGVHGREVNVLVALDPETVRGVEDPVAMGRGAYVEQYAEWMKEGHQAPPISVVETSKGTYQAAGDGHRRLAAARLAKLPIVAWLAPTGPHPEGLPEAGQTEPMRVGLTLEMVQKMFCAEKPSVVDIEVTGDVASGREGEVTAPETTMTTTTVAVSKGMLGELNALEVDTWGEDPADYARSELVHAIRTAVQSGTKWVLTLTPAARHYLMTDSGALTNAIDIWEDQSKGASKSERMRLGNFIREGERLQKDLGKPPREPRPPMAGPEFQAKRSEPEPEKVEAVAASAEAVEGLSSEAIAFGKKVANKVKATTSIDAALELIGALPGWKVERFIGALPLKGSNVDAVTRIRKTRATILPGPDATSSSWLNTYSTEVGKGLSAFLANVDGGMPDREFNVEPIRKAIVVSKSAPKNPEVDQVYASNFDLKTIPNPPYGERRYLYLGELWLGTKAAKITSPKGETFISYNEPKDPGEFTGAAFYTWAFRTSFVDDVKAFLAAVIKPKTEEQEAIDRLQTLDFTGRCGICLHLQKMHHTGETKSGKRHPEMYQHGYQIPSQFRRQGWAARVGVCFGSGRAPYDVSTEAIDAYLPVLQRALINQEVVLARLKAGPKSVTRAEEGRDEWLKPVLKSVTYTPSHPKWTQVLAKATSDAEGEVASTKQAIESYEDLKAKWVRTPTYDERQAGKLLYS